MRNMPCFIAVAAQVEFENDILKAFHDSLLSSAETVGAFNTSLDTVTLRPISLAASRKLGDSAVEEGH
jgi:hypothetical protein